jgi:hypothetical protein
MQVHWIEVYWIGALMSFCSLNSDVIARLDISI